ncbi:MAG: glycine cleavage system protein H [candidate division Zixibacteria bacterium 4484_95]|nr:MAG: glycine cleavage system protein H [candidate division Zixibacteria bacterium 4484_95]
MIPEELKYSKEHEWVKIDGDIATVGITDYAQGELGDIVFIELPAVGSKVEFMKPFGTIEAVKAVSDLFSPISGEVTEINTALEDDAGIINSSPYGDGWIIKVKISDPSEINKLLDPDGYKNLIDQD